MTPQRLSGLSPRLFWRSRLLGISFLSVLGMLAGEVARAQTADSVPDAAPVEIAPAEAPAPAIAAPTEPASPALDFNPPVDAAPSRAASEPASPSEFSENYIDSTRYSIGATQRSQDAPASAAARSPQVPSIAVPTQVQVGPLAVGDGGFSVVGRSTPSAQDYYNRTIRPPRVLGNGNISLIFPLSVPAPITSLFGWRTHPISGDQRFHSGTDLGAPMGTPVLAAYAGRVAIADFLGGYGLAVTLSHNKDTQQTLYGHLSEIFVKPGEWVEQGMVIGRVGSTGNSTGPHLHFEFRQLTPEGWVALDAGTQLEYALAQLVRAMQTGQTATQPTNFLGSLNTGMGGTVKLAAALPTPPAPALVPPQSLPIVVVEKNR